MITDSFPSLDISLENPHYLSIQILYERRSLIITDHSPPQNRPHVARRYLVLGDLHLGFEERFRSSGVKLSSNYQGMALEINQIVQTQNVTDLILNGDIKSSTDRISKSEWENVPRFLTSVSEKCHVSIIPGNHDGGLSNLLTRNVDLLDIGGLFIGGNLIIHGHTRPLAKYMDCARVIMGHAHPIFQRKGNPLSGQPAWVFAKVPRSGVFREALTESDSRIDVILMPSFNSDLTIAGFASEAAYEERHVSPLVKEIRDSDEAIITTLNGEVIGDESMLPNVV
ncbi:MAG: metallophosphoesterase [Nitrososphaerales archaeon]